MEKHNKKRASLRQYPVLLAFGLFFLGLFVLDLVTPDRAYSELENTTLAQRPKLTAPTADRLNNYFTGYTKYVKDQVAGRDQWISLQSVVETTSSTRMVATRVRVRRRSRFQSFSMSGVQQTTETASSTP